MGNIKKQMNAIKRQRREEAVVSYYQDLLVIKDRVETTLRNRELDFSLPHCIDDLGAKFFLHTYVHVCGGGSNTFYISQWGYRKLCFYIKICQWTLKKIYHWTDKELESE